MPDSNRIHLTLTRTPLLVVVCYLWLIIDIHLVHEQAFDFQRFLIPIVILSMLHFLLFQRIHSSMRTVLIYAVIVRFLLIFTDPFLSDDAYRFVWDGIVWKNGFNAYLYAPASADLMDIATLYADHAKINHPELTTVYYPIPQFFFFLNSLLFESIYGLKLIYLGTEIIAYRFILSRGWMSTRTLFAITLHPLLILETYSSAHFDVSFMLLILIFYLAGQHGALRSRGMSYFLTVFTKGYTVVFGFFEPTLRRVSVVAVIWMLIFSAWLTLIPDSGFARFHGNFFFNHPVFSSLYAFWLPDYNDIHAVIPYSWMIKLINAALIGGCILLIFRGLFRHRSEFYTAILLGFILMSSTVYPWYVLTLLPFVFLTGRWPLILFTYSIMGAYQVIPAFAESGTWEVPTFTSWVIYLPLLLYAVLRIIEQIHPPFNGSRLSDETRSTA